MVIEVMEQNFEQEVLKSEVGVLVDFWAPWCGPCQMVSPFIEQLAKDYNGRIKVGKINIDEAPEVATQFSIMSIPALILFKQGQVMEKRVGAMGKADLEKFIQPYL